MDVARVSDGDLIIERCALAPHKSSYNWESHFWDGHIHVVSIATPHYYDKIKKSKHIEFVGGFRNVMFTLVTSTFYNILDDSSGFELKRLKYFVENLELWTGRVASAARFTAKQVSLLLLCWDWLGLGMLLAGMVWICLSIHRWCRPATPGGAVCIQPCIGQHAAGGGRESWETLAALLVSAHGCSAYIGQ